MVKLALLTHFDISAGLLAVVHNHLTDGQTGEPLS
jgi:hypothetical protein